LAVMATAAVAATLATGCDGDAESDGDGDAQSAAAVDAPKGKGSPRAVTDRLVRLLVEAENKQDCKEVELVNDRSLYTLACPPRKALRESLRKFEVTGAATFGSGAVIDYRSGAVPDGASATLFVGPKGEWGISRFGLLYGRTVGTRDGPRRAAFDRAVDGYLRAVGARDCKLYRKHAATIDSTPKKGCEDEFRRTSAIGGAIAINGGAQPRYLGGNRILRFYGVTLRKPRPSYFTLSVIEASTSPPTVVVLDAAPGPASEPPERDLPASKTQS
jgi:hypothetical protein